MTDQTCLAAALRTAADLAETQWSPDPNGPGICSLLEMAALDDGRRPDDTDLWDAVVTHLDEQLTVPWERQPGRTRAEVAAMLRAAARVAVLAEVADWLKAWRPEFFERWAITEQERYEGGVDDAAAELRRMADEAQQPVGPCVAGEQPTAETPYPHTMLGAAELEEKPELNVPRLAGEALNAGEQQGEQQNETPEAEVVHGCPPDGAGLTPCCGRTPFELPLTDRISSEPAAVTCAPAVVAQPGKEA